MKSENFAKLLCINIYTYIENGRNRKKVIDKNLEYSVYKTARKSIK